MMEETRKQKHTATEQMTQRAEALTEENAGSGMKGREGESAGGR